MSRFLAAFGAVFRPLRGIMAVAQGLQAWRTASWQRDAEAAHRHAINAALRNPTPSGKLGNARLATFDNIVKAGLVNGGQGIFLGSFQGATLSYAGQSHCLTIAPNRSGKGRDVLLPTLAHLQDRSLVVLDHKGGELCFATAEHRAKRLGHRVLVLNPDRLLGLPSTRNNPLDRLIAEVARIKAERAGGAS